jgi:predicted permease
MEQAVIIFIQLFKLFIIGFVGFLAGKTKYLPEGTTEVLSKFVIKIAVPLLILTSMTSKNFSGEILKNGFTVYFFGVIIIFCGLIVGYFVGKRIKLEGDTLSLFSLQSTLGNIVYLGIPLINLLYGEEGLVYAVFFVFANDTILFSFGTYLINKEQDIKKSFKYLINGNIFAYVIGVICIAFNFYAVVHSNLYIENIYNILYETLYPLGQTTVYISMIFIGFSIAKIKIKNLKELIVRHFSLSFIKLIFLPMFALFLLYFSGINLSYAVIGTIVIQASTPCGSIALTLAASYDKDIKFGTETLMFSSLFSIISIPFIVYVMELIF